MKTVKRLFLLLLTAALLAGCAGRSAGESPRQVYFVAKSTDTQFWQAAFAGANAAAAEYNVELTVLGPETEEDYQSQNDYIAQAVQAGASALVFSAISYEGNAAAVEQAAKSGLKVVIIDSDVASDSVSVRIGTDNIEAGHMAASAVLDTDSESITVGIVNYDLNSRNGQERETGLREALSADGRVQEVYTINVLTTPQAAREGAEQLLAEHPEINVILGLNEPLAVGAAMAVDELGLEGQVRMVGFDTNVKCIDLMQTGAVTALVVQNPYAMGYLGVEYAWKLTQGESFDPNKLVDTSTAVITKENMFTLESQRSLFPFL